MGEINKKLYVKCKKKARKLYKHTKKNKNNLWQHVKCVEKIAKFFCKNTDLRKSQKYTVYLGCTLHDIGKTEDAKKWCGKENYDKKEHHTIGGKYLESKFFEKETINEQQKAVIISMVKNHKGKLNLDDLNGNIPFEIFAIALVRFADKMANEKICIIDGDVYVKL